MAGEALRGAGAAVIAVSAATILKSYRPELAVQVSIAAGLVVIALGIRAASGVAEAVAALLSSYGIAPEGMKAALKITGIAYIAQFAADTCRDCGESSIASKVELAGRLMMAAAAFPLIAATVEAIRGLMQG